MRFLGPYGRTRSWLRYHRYRLITAIARRAGDDVIVAHVTSRPDVAALFEDLQAKAPQARVVDPSVTVCEHRDWRLHFASRLLGHGLELGPLNRPLPIHDGMQVSYVDRADQATLQREFPKIAHHIPRVDILDDAETLGTVAPGTADFVVAAHVIEHMRNPIGALAHWARVVRAGGLIYLIVPDKRRMFDERRVRTSLEHLVLDYRQPSEERDFEHYLEYAALVHHQCGDAAIAEARRLRDTGFSIHFHVFLPQDVVRMVEWIGANVAPLTIVEGPVLSPAADEFHILLRKGALP
jgi:SAM-dependent methyltransferase